MLKKTVTYTDYNDVEVTENVYFNLNKAELSEMELTTPGGYSNMIRRIVAADDTPAIFRAFKELILKAYGEKSQDGRRFIKSPELAEAFSQTEAYSIVFMEITQDANKAAEFFNGLIPPDLNKTAATN